MATHLTVEQRLDWLTVRIAELELWVAREWVGLTDWTFDGAPLAVGAPWPERGGVHRLAHARVTPPWPDARLELDDRGRAVRGPGHRFAGLAGPGFGVAILNDGRYGHHALGSELGLSLLRSPIWPDPLADEGEQELVYALLPHVTDAELLAEAEDLNRPLLVHPSAALRGARTGVTGRAALGALKPLEDGEGLALRVDEPFGDRGRVTVTPPPGWALDTELDLLERPLGAPRTELDAFAVRTWSLRPTSSPPSR